MTTGCRHEPAIFSCRLLFPQRPLRRVSYRLLLSPDEEPSALLYVPTPFAAPSLFRLRPVCTFFESRRTFPRPSILLSLPFQKSSALVQGAAGGNNHPVAKSGSYTGQCARSASIRRMAPSFFFVALSLAPERCGYRFTNPVRSLTGTPPAAFGGSPDACSAFGATVARDYSINDRFSAEDLPFCPC